MFCRAIHNPVDLLLLLMELTTAVILDECAVDSKDSPTPVPGAILTTKSTPIVAAISIVEI